MMNIFLVTKTLKKYSVTILKIFFFIFHFLFQQ
uniref:Uncharacterized protein n=1 Tax=viral metagenome TaxID=1070528 RepID=A0A6C0JB78_9ZZZZ